MGAGESKLIKKGLFDPSKEIYHELVQVSENAWTFNTPFMYAPFTDISNRCVIVLIPPQENETINRLVCLNPSHLIPRNVAQIKEIEQSRNAALSDVITLSEKHWLYMTEWKEAFPNVRLHVPPGHIPSQNPPFAFRLMNDDYDNPLPQFLPHIQVLSVHGIRKTYETNSKLKRWELIAVVPGSNLLFSGDPLAYIPAPTMLSRLLGFPSGRMFFFLKLANYKAIGNIKGVVYSLKKVRDLLAPLDDEKLVFLSIHLGCKSIKYGDVKSDLDWIIKGLEDESKIPEGWQQTLEFSEPESN